MESKKFSKPMSAQLVFDLVVSHLAIQGRRSIDEGGWCVYGEVGGLQCAVGCLLPADSLARRREGTVTRVQALGLLPSGLEPHVNMLSKLQLVHDRSPTKEDVIKDLYVIARTYNLNDRFIPLITKWEY